MIILTIRTDKPEAEIGLYELDEKPSSHLEEAQGAGEKRSKAYMKYDARVQKPATQRLPESTGRAASLASRQAGAVREIAYIKWQAHKELSVTLNAKIDEILNMSSKSLEDIGGIIAFKGPGSFTGLRIGLSVANTLAYGFNLPLVSETGQNWITAGTGRLKNGENEKVAVPEYSSPAVTTQPRK